MPLSPLGPTVACVLRSGGEYLPEHVVQLYRGVQKHWRIDLLGYLHMICLTDMDFLQFGVENLPLIGGWPGWWSKMELFRPGIFGDLLYIDLDTAIAGDLTDIASVGKLTVLRDFYHKDQPEKQGWVGSGLMYLPEESRAAIWRHWIADPSAHMKRHQVGGDQKLLQELIGGEANRWQDVLPGQVVSYKVHLRSKKHVPKGARIICFHGRPRPWEVEPIWRQEYEGELHG